MSYISIDLESPVTYDAGNILELKVTFSAPQDSKYYLLGALYTTSYDYILDSMFGVLLPVDTEYAINSYTVTNLWEMTTGDENELNCKFTLPRSDVILGLFLMRLVGDTPSLDDDVEVGSVSVVLEGTIPVIPETIDWNSLLGGIVAVGMIGMMAKSIK